LFFTFVGRNTGTQPAHVQITKLGRMQGNDSEVVGQEALYRYFLSGTDPATGSLGSSAALLAKSGSLPGEVVILPGETQFIVPELNRAPVFKNWVSVVYLELTTDQPVTFYVEAVKQPTLDVDALSYLKPDVAEDGSITGRGTFEASEREMHFVIDSLPARLIIAADQYHSRQRWDDPPLAGTDEMNGAVTVDDGNYGRCLSLPGNRETSQGAGYAGRIPPARRVGCHHPADCRRSPGDRFRDVPTGRGERDHAHHHCAPGVNSSPNRSELGSLVERVATGGLLLTGPGERSAGSGHPSS